MFYYITNHNHDQSKHGSNVGRRTIKETRMKSLVHRWAFFLCSSYTQKDGNLDWVDGQVCKEKSSRAGEISLERSEAWIGWTAQSSLQRIGKSSSSACQLQGRSYPKAE